MSGQDFGQVTVEELAQRLAEGADEVQLIDVREPEELAIAQLPAFTNLPLSQYGTWAETITQQLDPNAETLVLCHHGMRSAQMCGWLVSQGFTNVKNITGGIHAYSVYVDRTVPQY